MTRGDDLEQTVKFCIIFFTITLKHIFPLPFSVTKKYCLTYTM